MISLYWRNQGKTEADRRPGKTFQSSNGSLMCDECCTHMITQDGPCNHFDRESCPFCLGTAKNASCFPACKHERLNEDGICRACGEDCRGFHS